MRKSNVSVKIEKFKELDRKLKILHQSNIKDQLKVRQPDETIAGDHEAIKLHVSICEMLAESAVGCVYGIKQIRKIVDLDCLLDSILAVAVPYVLKKTYLRLLFNGYIQQVEDVQMIDLSYPKFLQVMRYVVLYDVENYYMHFEGLAVPSKPEEERDDPVEEGKEIFKSKVVEDLKRVSEQMFELANENKNYKQQLEEKDFMMNLSPLNQKRYIEFLDSKDKAEFWHYFCSFNVELNKNDGLIYFVRDFFIEAGGKVDDWPPELLDICQNMKESILKMMDKLDQMKENYLDTLIDIDYIFYALDEAINALPSSQKLVKINTNH